MNGIMELTWGMIIYKEANVKDFYSLIVIKAIKQTKDLMFFFFDELEEKEGCEMNYVFLFGRK